MSEIPGDLKFLKSHEWVRVEGDGKATVGIHEELMASVPLYRQLYESQTAAKGSEPA